MNTMAISLHACALGAVDSFDIDASNWTSTSVSFDTKVLEAARMVVNDCTTDERTQLMHDGRRNMAYFCIHLSLLRDHDLSNEEAEAVAALIIGMYLVVML